MSEYVPAELRKLVSALDKLATKFPGAKFSIRLDAVGQYAANLIRFLESLPHKASISVGQPKQNKEYKSVHFPKQKSANPSNPKQ